MSGLRVIRGKARGRRLRSVPGDLTRPITDRVKEALFSIIGPDIFGASFLDLFAGTGSVGIEALSCGAGYACFVDLRRPAIDTIRANLVVTGLGNNADVIQMDAFAYLQRPNQTYDYIYIAPPQYKGLWRHALRLLDANPGWMAEDAWVIVQIHPKELEDVQFEHLEEFDRRQYGSTLLIFYGVK